MRVHSIGPVEIAADTNNNGVGSLIAFKTSTAERMRIDEAGQVLIGTTDVSGLHNGANVNTGSFFESAGLIATQRNSGPNIWCSKATGYTNSSVLAFAVNGSTVGSISITASSTAYNTSSDYRLKENVTDLTGAADRLAQIPVRRFNFIIDPARTVDGFLAHEVQTVIPEAVTGEKDAVDEDGNPEYQAIDQSKLVPLLTAALQEALTEINDLKTRVTALETA
jgi:hypothetical protein